MLIIICIIKYNKMFYSSHLYKNIAHCNKGNLKSVDRYIKYYCFPYVDGEYIPNLFKESEVRHDKSSYTPPL